MSTKLYKCNLLSGIISFVLLIITFANYETTEGITRSLYIEKDFFLLTKESIIPVDPNSPDSGLQPPSSNSTNDTSIINATSTSTNNDHNDKVGEVGDIIVRDGILFFRGILIYDFAQDDANNIDNNNNNNNNTDSVTNTTNTTTNNNNTNNTNSPIFDFFRDYNNIGTTFKETRVFRITSTLFPILVISIVYHGFRFLFPVETQLLILSGFNKLRWGVELLVKTLTVVNISILVGFRDVYAICLLCGLNVVVISFMMLMEAVNLNNLNNLNDGKKSNYASNPASNPLTTGTTGTTATTTTTKKLNKKEKNKQTKKKQFTIKSLERTETHATRYNQQVDAIVDEIDSTQHANKAGAGEAGEAGESNEDGEGTSDSSLTDVDLSDDILEEQEEAKEEGDKEDEEHTEGHTEEHLEDIESESKENSTPKIRPDTGAMTSTSDSEVATSGKTANSANSKTTRRRRSKKIRTLPKLLSLQAESTQSTQNATKIDASSLLPISKLYRNAIDWKFFHLAVGFFCYQWSFILFSFFTNVSVLPKRLQALVIMQLMLFAYFVFVPLHKLFRFAATELSNQTNVTNLTAATITPSPPKHRKPLVTPNENEHVHEVELTILQSSQSSKTSQSSSQLSSSLSSSSSSSSSSASSSSSSSSASNTSSASSASSSHSPITPGNANQSKINKEDGIKSANNTDNHGQNFNDQYFDQSSTNRTSEKKMRISLDIVRRGHMKTMLESTEFSFMLLSVISNILLVAFEISFSKKN